MCLKPFYFPFEQCYNGKLTNSHSGYNSVIIRRISMEISKRSISWIYVKNE